MAAPSLLNRTEIISSTDLDSFMKLRDNISKFLTRKESIVDTTLCAIISSGHILLEDVPGVGKTTFIKALAKMIDLEVSRIQFTSDLLPADVIGVEVFDSAENKFRFHKGPLFSNLIIADELNRASPRTQSALLEAMGEGIVSVDRDTYSLPKPFIVFASQNPTDNIGTYDIPESQMDRFSAKISLGYPEVEQEVGIFKASAADPLEKVSSSILSADVLLHVQGSLDDVHISDETANYVKRVVDATRNSELIQLGVSTRGGVMWLRMAKAKAILSGRSYVIPDDLQELAINCLSHRIITRAGKSQTSVIEEVISQTRVV